MRILVRVASMPMDKFEFHVAGKQTIAVLIPHIYIYVYL